MQHRAASILSLLSAGNSVAWLPSFLASQPPSPLPDASRRLLIYAIFGISLSKFFMNFKIKE
jgi:hypothetical protein